MSAGAGGDDRLLTVAEAAALCRMSKLAVYQLIEDGTLPVERVGKGFRVPMSSLREYLEPPRTS